MVFAAGTLRDSISTNWALSGRLAKTEGASHKNVVQFFGHPQSVGGAEWTKVVEVSKTNTPENEGLVVHPTYTEVTDFFTITCRYRVLGARETVYEEAEADIEDMTEEVARIIKLVFDPQAGTGTYYLSNSRWANADDIDAEQPELVRILNFSLTQVASQTEFVFRGYEQALLFSNTSIVDTLPGADYTYTEAFNVRIGEGYRVTTRQSRNKNPIKFRTFFGGPFRATMYAKKADFTASSGNQLDKIYLTQTNGELGTIKFVHRTPNTESIITTLQTVTDVMVTNITKDTSDESLVEYTINGEVISPSATTLVIL